MRRRTLAKALRAGIEGLVARGRPELGDKTMFDALHPALEVVSHSRQLAESAVELALEMARGAPLPIAIAAGLDGGVLGTDAVRVREAIDDVASSAGVLVVMDLGSAELALDLSAYETPVVLSETPLVEGLVAAVVLAAAGAGLDEVAADARRAGEIKATLLGSSSRLPGQEAGPDAQHAPSASIELVLHNPHGLHARLAARFVDTIRRFDAQVRVRNVTTGGQPVNGRSVSALSTLGAPRGHHVEVGASGRQAREAPGRRRGDRRAQLRRGGSPRSTGHSLLGRRPSPQPPPTGWSWRSPPTSPALTTLSPRRATVPTPSGSCAPSSCSSTTTTRRQRTSRWRPTCPSPRRWRAAG